MERGVFERTLIYRNLEIDDMVVVEEDNMPNLPGHTSAAEVQKIAEAKFREASSISTREQL